MMRCRDDEGVDMRRVAASSLRVVGDEGVVLRDDEMSR